MKKTNEDGLNPNEYRQFCRMLAAVLDRARKAEHLRFALDQSESLVKSLREENDRLKKNNG